jgi:hypothetical protein
MAEDQPEIAVKVTLRQAQNEANWKALWDWLLAPYPSEDAKALPSHAEPDRSHDGVFQSDERGELQHEGGQSDPSRR